MKVARHEYLQNEHVFTRMNIALKPTPMLEMTGHQNRLREVFFGQMMTLVRGCGGCDDLMSRWWFLVT